MSYKKHKSPNFKNLWSKTWQHGNLSRLCFWSSSSPQLLCFSSSCQMRHVWLHSHSSKKKKKTKLPAFPIQRRRPARWFRWRRTGGLATCWSRRPPFSSSANKQMSLSAFFLRFLIFKSLAALAALYPQLGNGQTNEHFIPKMRILSRWERNSPHCSSLCLCRWLTKGGSTKQWRRKQTLNHT